MRWMRRAAVIVMLVLLTAVLAVFLWFENRGAQAKQEANEKMEQEIRPLELERHSLQQELDSLNSEYTREAQGEGSLVLLFTNLDERIYTEIFPIMKEFGFAGVLALSENSFPGGEGCMSREQFEELMDAGWECCLKWKPGSDTGDWAEAGGRLAANAGVDCPAAAYFPADTYEAETDDILKKRGFLTAVHHGEGGLSVVSSEIGEGLWHPGAMGWEQKGASKMMDEAVAQRGNLIFTIGTDAPGEEYEKDSYIAMLEKANVYRNVNDLQVTTLTGAREYRKSLEEGRSEIDENYSERKMQLEAQMKELNERINEIIEKYGGQSL